jgi:hypothetical protein
MSEKNVENPAETVATTKEFLKYTLNLAKLKRYLYASKVALEGRYLTGNV